MLQCIFILVYLILGYLIKVIVIYIKMNERIPNYSVFYFVAIIVVIFYVVILRVLSSSISARKLALKSLVQ